MQQRRIPGCNNRAERTEWNNNLPNFTSKFARRIENWPRVNQVALCCSTARATPDEIENEIWKIAFFAFSKTCFEDKSAIRDRSES